MHAVTQAVTVQRRSQRANGSVVYLRPRSARASHPRLVKIARISRRRWREQALSLVLAIQLVVLFVMPASRALGSPMVHPVVRGLLLLVVLLALVLARSRAPSRW